MLPVNTEPCTYAYAETGIHEMTFLESSRAAVDQMITNIYNALEITPAGQPALYLIDNSQVEALPLKYLTQRIREVGDNRADDRPPGRIALLYDGVMGTIANTLLRIALKNELRFFKAAHREEAITWLLQN